MILLDSDGGAIRLALGAHRLPDRARQLRAQGTDATLTIERPFFPYYGSDGSLQVGMHAGPRAERDNRGEGGRTPSYPRTESSIARTDDRPNP